MTSTRNIVTANTDLSVLCMDQITMAYEAIQRRLRATAPGSRAGAREMNRGQRLREEAFSRGFSFVRCTGDVYSFQRTIPQEG